jgi:hypothetical protein
MLGAVPYSTQGEEATKLSQLINHSLEIMANPNEEQSLLLLQYF